MTSSTSIYKGPDLHKRLEKYLLTEKQLRDNGYMRPSDDDSSAAKIYKPKKQEVKDGERVCARCNVTYAVTEEGDAMVPQECFYHHAKNVNRNLGRYECCNRGSGSRGCQVAPSHVNEQNVFDDFTGFKTTSPTTSESDPKNTNVFALDCEMVFTKAGLELAEITLIGDENQVVYHTLVKPDTEIIDYHTRFSGLKAKDMEGVVKTSRDMQDELLNLISDRTILLGHSLESDLKAVKLIHSSIVDTSIAFPHNRGLPYKRALRHLAKDHLGRIIQNRDSGHDSIEDAKACMDLMMYKIKQEDNRSRLPFRFR